MNMNEPTSSADLDAEDRVRETTHAGLQTELERLRAWKSEALPVMTGLQELGRALGVPLGQQITARAAVDIALDLRNRCEKAEAGLAAVKALIELDGGVFLPKDTKIKRVQEDRRHDLGAIVTTSMVTVADVSDALSSAAPAASLADSEVHR